MTQETKLLGCLAQFALAGTVQSTPSAGTVSKTFIPDNAGTDSGAAALWMSLGIIKAAKEKVDSTKNEIYRNAPGSAVLDDVLESKFKRTLNLTVGECSNLMWGVLRRSFKTTSTRTGAIGQHVPLTGGTIRGWLKFQSYNQDTNAQELVEQFYCVLTIDGDVSYGDDKTVEFPLTATVLWSNLNSATGS